MALFTRFFQNIVGYAFLYMFKKILNKSAHQLLKIYIHIMQIKKILHKFTKKILININFEEKPTAHFPKVSSF